MNILFLLIFVIVNILMVRKVVSYYKDNLTNIQVEYIWGFIFINALIADGGNAVLYFSSDWTLPFLTGSCFIAFVISGVIVLLNYVELSRKYDTKTLQKGGIEMYKREHSSKVKRVAVVILYIASLFCGVLSLI